MRDWAKFHTDELLADWDLVINEKPLNPIDPLYEKACQHPVTTNPARTTAPAGT